MERDERFRLADRVIHIGLWANAALMIMKLLAGRFGDSEAVFADGVESACDFVAILSSFIALKIGRKPCDAKHPYGYGKAECLSAIFVSLVIFGSGALILYQASVTLWHGYAVKPQGIALGAAVATIVIKEGLFRYTRRVSTQLGSPALDAIANDHRKDALTSLATLVGVAGAFGGAYFMDPLAAGLTAFFIFGIGWETFRRASHDLMDGRPPEALLSKITALAEGVPGVEHVHEIRGRRSGQYIIVDLKLEMDPQMTVKESHEIATDVKRRIFKNMTNVGDVMIHINPHEEAHEDLIRL